MKIDLKTTARDLELNSGVQTVNFELDESGAFQPGVLVSVIHFILSKLRSKKGFKLVIDISNIDEKNLSKRFFEYYQLVAIILFIKDEDVTIVGGNGVTLKELKKIYVQKLLVQEYVYTIELGTSLLDDNKSKDVETLRKAIFSLSSKSRLSKGFSLMIPCFDHIEELKRTDYLYSGKKIKSSRDISKWVQRLFRFHKLKLDPSGLHNEDVSHVSRILKELFQNTNDWARTTYDEKNEYLPNFRASYLSLYLEDRISHELGSIDSIDDYIKSVNRAEINDLQIANSQAIELFPDFKVSIFEISVIDTGPGMARRWLESDYNEIDSEKEKNAVLKCFLKYATSDSSGLMTLRGQGLSNVLKIIGRIGLLKVSSGGVLLTRNFLEKNLSQSELDSEQLEFNYRKVNRVEGTCITILYPIIYS